MNHQNIDSDFTLLNDAELDATRGGQDLMAADDPGYIPADDPADRPLPTGWKPTKKQQGDLNKWFARIR